MTSDADTEFNSVAHSFDDAVVFLRDPDGVIKHWTTGCERLYGWRAEDAVGQIFYDLLQSEFSEPVEDVHRKLQDGGRWHGELAQRHKNGRKLIISSRWVKTNVATQDTSASMIAHTDTDLTELRELQNILALREAYLQSILNTVPDAMISIDERGQVLSFNPAAERLFGFPSNEICGQNVNLLMPHPDRERHDRYMARYLRTGERHIIDFGRIVLGQRRDGTTFPMEVSVGETINTGRRIFTSVIRDLTSRHRVEEELRQLQKMEAVGQLTGGLAHDFNNLLTVITGNLEMLYDRLAEADEPLRLMVREAQDAANDGAKLTSQLLSFGRRQHLDPRQTNIGQLIVGFAELLRRTLGERVQLRTILTADENTALVDAAQLQNALLNLALNARDAMPSGGQLTLEVTNVALDAASSRYISGARPGHYVLIEVSDTGVGMTADVLAKALEPFFTTKGPGAGSGLGLSMVYGFAKQSGGDLQITSESGRGTVVRIFLPRTVVRASARKVQSKMAITNGGAETILLVEDDPRVRRSMVARLSGLGYSVIQAGNAFEALEQLDRHPEIALILTDVIMPGGMTGEELAEIALQKAPALKILFTSGYAEPEIAARQLKRNGHWLQKPFSTIALAAHLRLVLDTVE